MKYSGLIDLINEREYFQAKSTATSNLQDLSGFKTRILADTGWRSAIELTKC